MLVATSIEHDRPWYCAGTAALLLLRRAGVFDPPDALFMLVLFLVRPFSSPSPLQHRILTQDVHHHTLSFWQASYQVVTSDALSMSRAAPSLQTASLDEGCEATASCRATQLPPP